MSKFAKFVVWLGVGVCTSVLLVGAPALFKGHGAIATTQRLTATVPAAAIAQQTGDLGIPQDFEPLAPGNFPSRDLRFQSEDPADQIAPPGLLVRPGDAPISHFFGLRMQKELDSLVGRFESALFLASAADQPTQVQLPTVNAAVTTSEDKSLIASSGGVTSPVLQEARQLRQDWPGLLENQAYGEARTRWLQVRENLWANFPLDRPFAQPEIRSMWLDRGSNVRAGSRPQQAALIDNLQASGIKTVNKETV
ncbi:MAG: hypothetical protein ACFB12_08340, partial [Leptolyngbyaceae cyanobacterium]